jgi:hypothetical protein
MEYATSAARMKARVQLPGREEAAGLAGPDTREEWLALLEPALAACSPESLRVADRATRALT